MRPENRHHDHHDKKPRQPSNGPLVGVIGGAAVGNSFAPGIGAIVGGVVGGFMLYIYEESEREHDD